MNNRFFISLAAVAVSLVSLPSCQKDQDSVFKESLTERQAQYLDGFRSLIKGSENGWAMYYFSGGAYATSRVFTVSFTDNEVTASSEDAPSVTAKSFYKVAVTSAHP